MLRDDYILKSKILYNPNNNDKIFMYYQYDNDTYIYYKDNVFNKISIDDVFDSYIALSPLYVIGIKKINNIYYIIISKYNDKIHMMININDYYIHNRINTIDIKSIYRDKYKLLDIKNSITLNYIYGYYDSDISKLLNHICNVKVDDIIKDWLKLVFNIYYINESVEQMIHERKSDFIDYLRTVTRKSIDSNSISICIYNYSYNIEELKKYNPVHNLVLLKGVNNLYIVYFEEIPVIYRSEDETGMSVEELKKFIK